MESIKLIDINPPVYFYIVILIMLLVHLFIPVLDFISYPFTLLGIIPAVIGIVFNLLADASFKKQGTTVKPHEETKVLITNGIFHFSRNPMYLGFGLILFGIGIFLGTLLPFAAVIGYLIFLDVVFIRFEETKLERNFGIVWIKYKDNVRRWI
jgi:protein-S-isoprenylcysteine O-methyltransferase Ste14